MNETKQGYEVRIEIRHFGLGKFVSATYHVPRGVDKACISNAALCAANFVNNSILEIESLL